MKVDFPAIPDFPSDMILALSKGRVTRRTEAALATAREDENALTSRGSASNASSPNDDKDAAGTAVYTAYLHTTLA